MKTPIMIVCDIDVKTISVKYYDEIASKVENFLRDTCGSTYVNCFRFERGISVEEVNGFFAWEIPEGLPIKDWQK